MSRSQIFHAIGSNTAPEMAARYAEFDAFIEVYYNRECTVSALYRTYVDQVWNKPFSLISFRHKIIAYKRTIVID